MSSLSAYIPIDRRHALAAGQTLPDRTQGAALFADISGFSLLTEALTHELGPARGAEELVAHLDSIYESLIAEVHRFGGSVVAFSGDAITRWFDQDDGRRAIACAFAVQRAMEQFAAVPVLHAGTVSMAVKVAVAS